MVLYTFFHFFVKIKTLSYPIITDVLWTIRKGIILHRVPEFLSSRLNWVPYPASEFPPPTWVLWGQTLACGKGGGGIQFRRLDRKSGILCGMIPLLDYSWLTVSTKTAAFNKCLYVEASMSFEFVK